MPTAYVKKMAKKHGVSVKKAEGEWSDAKSIAKKQYGKNNKKLWGTVVKIFKNKMNAHYKEGFICSFDDYINEGYTKQLKYMKTNFFDFLNEDINDKEEETGGNKFIWNMMEEYNLSEIDAVSLFELHNKIINEKDRKKKDDMIDRMFKELNIQHDEYEDLKNYVYSWCFTPEEIKLKKLYDFALNLFLKEYENKLTYNDSVMLENYYNKVFHKAMGLKLDTDILEISGDVLSETKEKFQEKEKSIDIYYNDEEILHHSWK